MGIASPPPTAPVVRVPLVDATGAPTAGEQLGAILEGRRASEGLTPIEWEAEMARIGCGDADVPWWKVALLPLRPGTRAHALRRRRQRGDLQPHTWTGLDTQIWQAVVETARADVPGTVESWLRDDPERCRHASLTCVRAFTQFADLLDDDLNPLVLKDFHVRAIRYMRTVEQSVILFPFAHGKSACSSLTVPLMDWVENPECTQIRVYRTNELHAQWTRKLMDLVEHSDHLHALTSTDQFPDGYLNKPGKQDPCGGDNLIWSTKGFSIAGKQVVDPSFRPLTIRGSVTGLRADRIGIDDVVDENNAKSLPIQDRLEAVMKSGVFTAQRRRSGARWTSKYETIFGNAFLIGTPFDKRDVNYRMAHELEARISRAKEHAPAERPRYRVVRLSVYPRRDSRERGEVIWPEHRPFSYILDLEESLQGAFRMRCECLPGGEGTEVFDQKRVRAAIRRDYAYGVRPPEGCRMVIGYDPALGKRMTGRKHPAAVALGHNPENGMWYFVRYERWDVSMPEQCERLARWADELECPVVVESNNIQESYADWLQMLYGYVRVLTQYTGQNKHDIADGVESFKPLFDNGKVIICAGDSPTRALGNLVSEMIDWPGRYTDLVMAGWIAKHKLTEMLRTRAATEGPGAPGYVRSRGFRQVVDLSRYRR